MDVGHWNVTEPPSHVRLRRLHVPLLSPHRSAHGEESLRDVIVVEWTTGDGTSGWGECPTLSSPGYVTETTDQAWRGLVDRLVPSALETGRVEAASDDRLIAAASAVRDAATDAWLRRSGTSLRAHLGGTAVAVGRCAVLADVGADADAVAEHARRAVGSGAEMVKVKIRPGADVEIIEAVQRSVPGVRVAADANGSYGDIAALGALDALGLEYLEQPLHHSADWVELAAVCDAMSTPVALDESLTSLDAVRSALSFGAATVISLKPARMGGVEVAAAAARSAGEQGVAAFVGGMLELGIGRATAAALASMAQCSLPTDLGPSAAYVTSEICAEVELDEHGRLLVPDGVGFGRVPDPSALGRFTVDEMVFSRSGARPRRGAGPA